MPVISEIELQKKKKDRFNIFLDGEFYVGVSADTLVKHSLYKGKEITLESMQQLVFDEAEQKIFDRAANLLSKSLKSEKEVVQKIREWLYKSEYLKVGVNQEIIEKNVIERLKNIQLINDVRYAQAFIEDRMRFRPKAQRLIEYELITKGIDKETVKNALAELGIDEVVTAEEVLYKKFKVRKIEKGDQKKIAYLNGKGFDWDTISDLIND
jgi:regulatory protein